MHKLTDIDDFLSKLEETNSFKAYKEQEVWDYFQNNPISNNEDIVSHKLYLLNRSYKTHIPKDTVKSICAIKGLDKKIKDGDPRAVTMIVDAIEKFRGKKYYSFATKYCAMQNPNAFPIYDSIVGNLFEKMLKHKMIVADFICDKIIKEDLKDYSKYKDLYNLFAQQFGVEKKHLYRDIDLYLWGGANENIQKELKKETQFMKYYNQKITKK